MITESEELRDVMGVMRRQAEPYIDSPSDNVVVGIDIGTIRTLLYAGDLTAKALDSERAAKERLALELARADEERERKASQIGSLEDALSFESAAKERLEAGIRALIAKCYSCNGEGSYEELTKETGDYYRANCEPCEPLRKLLEDNVNG